MDPELLLHNKEDFVKTCANNHLDQVDLLRLRKFNEHGIYQFAAQALDNESRVDKQAFKKFKKDCSSFKKFQENTCW